MSNYPTPSWLTPHVYTACLCPVLPISFFCKPVWFERRVSRHLAVSSPHVLAPPLFADMSSWNASEEVIPGFRRCLDIWYCLLLFVISRVWDCTLICRFHTESGLGAAPLTGRSVKWITITWLRQQKRDVALRLDNCNYNLDLMRLLPVSVYLCVWME